MVKLLLPILFFLQTWSLIAQTKAYNEYEYFIKANSYWAFGINSGIDFNTNTTVITQMQSGEGCAAVSDTGTGDLLFYSNGMIVYDASHNPMPNGLGLLGSNAGTTSQGVCIVPVIGNPNEYYHFSLNYQATTPSLYYSIIDMTMNGGAGDVDPNRKDIILDQGPLSESMIAVPGNNCDVWLIVHTFEDPVFKAYHITKDGLNTVPVISTTGSILGYSAYYIGCMSVSPNREMIAISSYGEDGCWAGLPSNPDGPGVLLAKFDPATGEVSNSLKVIGDTIGSYGSAFSPDNNKLYITTENMFGVAMYQYDLSTYDSATIVNSREAITTYVPDVVPSYLRLYKDTIFLNSSGGIISSINQPNLTGNACDYQLNRFTVQAGTELRYGLGSDVVYPLPPDTFGFIVLDTLICTEGQSGAFDRTLLLEASSSYDGYIWSDGTTEETLTIDTPGTYWVLCIDSCHSRYDTFVIKHADFTFDLGPDTFFCEDVLYVLDVPIPEASFLWHDGSTDSFMVVEDAKGLFWVEVRKNGCKASDSVTIFNKDFTQDLGEDKMFCKGDPINIKLTANIPDGATALWSTGEQGATIIINDSGTYWVTVQEPPCIESDTIRIDREICECFFNVPNAFTPNDDGVNDIFRPIIELNCPISSYSLNIYNRYGQRVFITSNPEIGWDGMMNETKAETGVYFYELSFYGGTRKHHYVDKGDLTLIR